MAMSWSSLSASKGSAGALATWVGYSLLDVPTTIDEAQTLLYSLLRVREMRTDYQFTMTTGMSYIALPSRFLDPIGRIRQLAYGMPIRHKDENFVANNQFFTETSGTLGTDPFTTVSGSDTVTVAATAHGFSQGSSFYTTGASAFNGATISGTFPITSVATNTFTIDISSLGTTPSGSGAGGGASCAYTCENLVQGTPQWFGIWNERIYFDAAFPQTTVCKLQYFQSLPLLSATNLTNFLTNRYPHLLRTACMASAASFMKDDGEYQKNLAALQGMVAQTSIENDMAMRGMEFDQDIP